MNDSPWGDASGRRLRGISLSVLESTATFRGQELVGSGQQHKIDMLDCPALEKLSRASQVRSMDAHPSTAHLFIALIH